TLSALSSPAITSAPPAFSAWQLASPEPPRPNTATVLPANEVTGIMASPQRRPHPEERPEGTRLEGCEPPSPARGEGKERRAPTALTAASAWRGRPAPASPR